MLQYIFLCVCVCSFDCALTLLSANLVVRSLEHSIIKSIFACP